MITYTGTAEDHKLLLAEGNLEREDPFTTLTVAEVRERFAWVTRKVAYNAWWRGFEQGRASVTKPSLLHRILGWFV